MGFAAIHTLTADKTVLRCCRHRRWIVRVLVVVIVDGPVIYDRCIVNIRVRNVYVANVVSAMAVPRAIGLTKTEWEPPYSVAEPAAESDSYAPASAAKKSNECWAINWRGINRPRTPAPAAMDVRPPSVMVRSESPRLIVDP